MKNDHPPQMRVLLPSPPARPRNTRARPVALSRRTLLRGSLFGAAVRVGLPVLDGMLNDSGTALAQSGSPLPTRFGVFYWGGGITHQYWVPAQTGMSWTLPMILEPFAELRRYLTLVTGLHHHESSPGHIPARGIALSSSHDRTVCQGNCVGTYRGQNMPEPSIDAIVSEAWQGKTPLRSVEIGICRKGPYRSNSSWQRGGTTYNRHEPSPKALWDRLFANLPAGGTTSPAPSMIELTTAYEWSMLDAVVEDARDLQRQVGAHDRQRLEAHLEGLRAIERQLQARERMPASSPQDPACTRPDAPPTRDFGDGGSREEKEDKSRLMSDLLAAALACDLTRVFSYEWSATQNGSIYWEVGSNEEHHEWNHRASRSIEYARSIQFIMKNLAYLARALANRREGDGTLLDRTLIFATSEHADAGAHDYRDHPLLFVGGASGRIRAGLHHRGAGPIAPRALLTAVRLAGVPLARLGQGEDGGGRVATESLGAIEA